MLHNFYLACYILTNTLVFYVLLRNPRLIYERLGKAVDRSKRYGKSTIKGVTTFLAMILAPVYICGVITVHAIEPLYTPTCKQPHYYQCVPSQEENMQEHQKLYLITKFVLFFTSISLYLLAAVYTVKTTKQRVVFQRQCYSFLEVYLLWGILVCIHIVIGLASFPFLTFLMLIPMYTLFYVSSWIIGLAILTVPVTTLFHKCQGFEWQAVNHYTLFRICDLFLIYTLGSSLTIVSFLIYYKFLLGGASMRSIKGILFSLFPPLCISMLALMVRRKLFQNN